MLNIKYNGHMFEAGRQDDTVGVEHYFDLIH